MRGEPNTKVLLTIFRKSESRTFPVSITREEIRTQSVRSKVIEPGYAWIRVSQFQERTVADFARKIEEIYKEEPQLKGLVLDLRNDPGGYLDAAVALSAAFLPENVTVVSANGQLAESKFTYKASPQYYQRRGGPDPLRRLQEVTKGVLKTFLWWCSSMKVLLRPARSWQGHCRTTNAPRSWEARRLARARYKPPYVWSLRSAWTTAPLPH